MDNQHEAPVPEKPEDEFYRMEKMLKDAQEKLAQFQRDHEKKQGIAAESKPEKPKEEVNLFAELCKKLPEDQFPLGYSLEDDKPVTLPIGKWHRLGVYIGRKNLVPKVLGNLLTAAKHANMQVMVLRRKLFTEFKTGTLFQHAHLEPGDAFYWNGDASGMEILTRVLHREITNQNVFRDEFCEKDGIPADDPGRTAKASAWIRQHTRTLLVVFESVADLTRAGAPQDLADGLALYLTASGAYNIRFIGLFSPDDGKTVWEHPLARAFTEAESALLTGGKYDGQRLADIPDKMAAGVADDVFFLRNGTEIISGMMPSGDLRTDLDEFSLALQELMQATKAYQETENGEPSGEGTES